MDIDGPVTLTTHQLVDGRYKIIGEATGVISVSQPASLSIDVAELLPHRR